MKNVVVLSTKRSTHHAFIESFLKGKRYVYENNIVQRKGVLEPGKVVSSGELSDLYVLSFERGYRPEKCLRNPLLHEKLDGGVEKATVIAFLRDPLNTIASSYSVYLKNKASNEDYPISYVYNNINQYSYLLEYLSKRENSVSFVYANKFWEDSMYREKLQAEFGFQFKVFDRVSKFAGGGHSFFEGDKVKSNDINSRFLSFVNDPVFIDIIKENYTLIESFFEYQPDEDLVDSFKENFDFLP